MVKIYSKILKPVATSQILYLESRIQESLRKGPFELKRTKGQINAYEKLDTTYKLDWVNSAPTYIRQVITHATPFDWVLSMGPIVCMTYLGENIINHLCKTSAIKFRTFLFC